MKNQAPSSKLHRNIKHQATEQDTDKREQPPFVAWDLELLWSLEIGAWSFS
jgi:hypothetical protein